MVRAAALQPERRELTIASGPMGAGDLPSGVGSFHGIDKKDCLQTKVVYSCKLDKPPSFPAQHPASAESGFDCEQIENGVRLTYRGLDRDATAELVQELTVAPDTGDLYVRQRGRSANPGVFGASFSLLNLRPEIEFAVPYFGGQRFGGHRGRGAIQGFAWPGFWSAGLVVGELPEGGSFFVFADDPRLRWKAFKLYNSEAVQGLSFEACAAAPFAQRTEVAVCTWRFNTFGGSWMEPAERYKQWLARTYELRPLNERSCAWFEDIAMVWPGGINAGSMRLMATRLDPKRILILSLGWAKGFNRNCPLYEPRSAKEAENVKLAHELGYRYGVYVSMKLIDPKAHPGMMAKYGVTCSYDALRGDPPPLPDPVAQPNRRLVGIHPGSDAWIEFYSDLMVDFHKQYGIDLFYQDVAGGGRTCSGLLDGRTLHEGSVACDRATRRKLPNVALGGEFWSEVNLACGEELGLQNFMAWFGERHNLRLARNPHPLLSYLFSDFCRYMSYRTPVRSGAKWHRDQNTLEVMGALPTWRTFAADEGGEVRVVLERAKLFAAGFRPWFPKNWASGVAAYMRAPDGRQVKLLRPEQSTFCWEETAEGDKLRYARVTGVSRPAISEPVVIDGWFAYDEKGPIGLDPSKWYCAFPGKPPELAVRITALPEGVAVSGARTGEGYCLAELGGAGKGRVAWESKRSDLIVTTASGRTPPGARSVEASAPTSILFGFGEAPEVHPDEPLPLDGWSKLRVAHGQVVGPAKWRQPPRDLKLGGVKLRAYGVFPFTGGAGAEVSVDGRVRLPSDSRVALSFHMGRLGGRGDGVNFVVRVNGALASRTFSNPGKRSWTPVVVPLGEYAGREVVLSLALDAGPSGFNTSNDESFWGGARLVLVDQAKSQGAERVKKEEAE